jgi:hypothetical protein
MDTGEDDCPVSGPELAKRKRPYSESLDTDPGFIGSVCSSENESEVGGGLWERRGGWIEGEGRKNFCKKIRNFLWAI